jgi:hypothetical protein
MNPRDVSIRETLSKGYLAVPSRIIWERMSPSDDPLSDYRLTLWEMEALETSPSLVLSDGAHLVYHDTSHALHSLGLPWAPSEMVHDTPGRRVMTHIDPSEVRI